MLKSYLRRFFCGVLTIALLTSCGEEELGGGIGEFTTVNASAVASTNRFESDIVTGNTCTDAVSAGGTIGTDNVNFSVTSTALFATGSLNLLISRITVHYTPANATAPALPDYVIATGQTIAPGSTATVPVAIVPEVYKRDLLDRPTQNLVACSSDIFEYFVRVTFEVSEPGGNGKIRNVTADLNLAIADRNN